MNTQKRRALRFTSTFAVSLAAFAGGCAAQKPTVQTPVAQIAKTPIAATQNAPIQTPKVDVQKQAERRVFASAVAALQFSTDGKTLASAGGTKQNANYPDWPGGAIKVEILDAKTLRATKTLPLLPESVLAVFSPDLKRIVLNPSVYHGLQLFDATNGKSLWRQYTDKPDYPPLPNGADALMSIMKLAISPRGDKVLTCNQNGRFVEGYVEWWFLEQQKLLPSPDTEETDMTNVPGLNDEVLCYRAAFSPDSKTYVIGSRENTLALFDIKANKMMWAQEKYYQDEKFVKPDNDAVIQAITFSPDGKTIATGNVNHLVYLWNAQTGALLRTIKLHSQAVQRVVFSPDSSVVASGGDDGIVVLSSTRNGATLGTLNAKRGSVTALTWAPDGKTLASGFADGMVSLWRVG